MTLYIYTSEAQDKFVLVCETSEYRIYFFLFFASVSSLSPYSVIETETLQGRIESLLMLKIILCWQ
jgi:hypothetical protein